MSILDHDTVYFMRHGQTAQNAAKVIGGSTDAPLTALGLEQARIGAESLRDIAISRIHVSPLQRAVQTAEAVIAVKPHLSLQIAPLLQERNWGVLEGQSREFLRRELTPDRGEGPDQFRQRIHSGLEAIPVRKGDAPILIVAHSGTSREIFSFLGLPVVRPDNCAVFRFRRAADGWKFTQIHPFT